MSGAALLLADMDAAGWGVIIAAVFLGVTQILRMVLDFFRDRERDRQEAAKLLREMEAIEREKATAIKVAQVAVKLEEETAATTAKLDEIAETGVKTLGYVNSAMGAQLKLHAQTARARANDTKSPADIAVAEMAEKLSNEHQAKAALVEQAELRKT